MPATLHGFADLRVTKRLERFGRRTVQIGPHHIKYPELIPGQGALLQVGKLTNNCPPGEVEDIEQWEQLTPDNAYTETPGPIIIPDVYNITTIEMKTGVMMGVWQVERAQNKIMFPLEIEECFQPGTIPDTSGLE